MGGGKKAEDFGWSSEKERKDFWGQFTGELLANTKNEIRVQVKDSNVVGECIACDRLHGVKHRVWEVHLHNVTIRLCDNCRLELSRKLRTVRTAPV